MSRPSRLGAALARAIAATWFAAAAHAEIPAATRDVLHDLLELQADFDLPAPPERAARLQRGAAAVERARLTGNRDADPALEMTLQQNAVLLLRMRVLEAQAHAWGLWMEGIDWALAGDSLAATLAPRVRELALEEAVLAFAAGLAPPRCESQNWTAKLYEEWRRRWFAGPAATGDVELLLFFWLAQRDERVLDDAAQRAPRSETEAALSRLALAARGSAGRSVFAADDPGRRLALAIHALVADGAVSAELLALAARAADRRDRTPTAHRARIAALDSLQQRLSLDMQRATPILGTRHNYYRKPGTTGPVLDSSAAARARQLALRSIAALRFAAGDAALASAGVQASGDLEPVEIVPNQYLIASWSLSAATPTPWSGARTRIAGQTIELTQVPDSLTDSTLVRTRFASLGHAAIGTTLVPSITLAFTLPEWGAIEIQDRAAVRVVAPIQAYLAPSGGGVVHGTTKMVEAIVTSRAPEPISGTLRVLGATDFRVLPAPSFRFDLRRPGQSARAKLELTWPPQACPGTYEIAAKIEVGGDGIGTLRARLVRPLLWAIAGPFPTPGPGTTLAPENGVDLEARFPSAGGMQLTWQAAPVEGYDSDGALDLEALFPGIVTPSCAVAFTVIESPAASIARLQVEGATRVRWNGGSVPADGRVQLERGRNTLLARSANGAHGWRLRAAVTTPEGEPLRILANDLDRLLDGFDRLGKAAWRRPGEQPTDRLVTLRYRTGKAADVAVLGVFNAWVPQTLARQPDGTWLRDLRLLPGRYPYKLLVDGRLRPDPEATASEPDGFGGRNSLLIVR